MEVSIVLDFATCADLYQEPLSREYEYLGANKPWPTGVDDSDEEEHNFASTGAGKAIKKLKDKRKKNDTYKRDQGGEDPFDHVVS